MTAKRRLFLLGVVTILFFSVLEIQSLPLRIVTSAFALFLTIILLSDLVSPKKDGGDPNETIEFEGRRPIKTYFGLLGKGMFLMALVIVLMGALNMNLSFVQEYKSLVSLIPLDSPTLKGYVYYSPAFILGILAVIPILKYLWYFFLPRARTLYQLSVIPGTPQSAKLYVENGLFPTGDSLFLVNAESASYKIEMFLLQFMRDSRIIIKLKPGEKFLDKSSLKILVEEGKIKQVSSKINNMISDARTAQIAHKNT